MTPHTKAQFDRLVALMAAALRPPPGRGRILIALAFGVTVHLIFAAAVLAMIIAMFFGMSMSLGRVPAPWSHLCNALLLLQFPLTHSLLLGSRGGRLLNRVIPVHGPDPLHHDLCHRGVHPTAPAVRALDADGIVWWRAEGFVFWAISSVYAASWLLLLKASFDAGAEVQSGALGWMSLLANRRPVYPDMPMGGLFRVIRQPIYVAFALTLWTVPVWTPDQLVIALAYTAYCLLAPMLKERRFATRYGARFEDYQSAVPYALPRFRRSRKPLVRGDADTVAEARTVRTEAGPASSPRPSPAET